MAPPSKLIGLTSEEKISRERERNRRKSAALRARKKAQKEKTIAEDAGSSSSSAGSAVVGPNAAVSGMGGNEAVIGRLVARLAELGEGGDQIGKLVGGNVVMSFEGCSPPVASSSAAPQVEVDFVGWDVSEFDLSAEPFFVHPRAGCTSGPAEEPRNVTRFGALMNDAGPAFSLPQNKPVPDLSQLSHLSFPTLNVDQIRLALNLSAASPHLPPHLLPTYSYSSFASSLTNYPSSMRSDDYNIEWKWRLFEFIRVSHENRNHPTEGYLRNGQMDALVSSAQLIILKLLTSTSTLEKRAKFDARRPLEKSADRDYYEHAEMDPRIFHVPQRGPRVHISRITQAGLVSLTELIADSMDICTIHGDVWDSTGWSMAKPPWPPLIPADSIDKISTSHGPDQPIGLQHLVRGASVREIILGIEQPGWRLLDDITGSACLTVAPLYASLPSVINTSSTEDSCFFEKPFWSYWVKGWHAGSVRIFG